MEESVAKQIRLATELGEAELEDVVARQVLDEEEQEVENALSKVKDAKGLNGMGSAAANAMWTEILANTERKSPVTLRISDDVMRRIRLKAREEGLPYQTLINSVLHKFAHGRSSSRD
jgi:predicted DNA binding CopG/RHH family protein